MFALLQRINRGIDTVLSRLIVGLIGLMTLVVSLEVFQRGRFSNYTEEAARFCLVYVAILGSAYAVRLNAHLGIDALTRLFPPPAKRMTAVAVNLIIMAFSLGVMIVGGVLYMKTFPDQTASALTWMKMRYIYAALPVAGLLNLCYCAEAILRQLRGLPAFNEKKETL